MNKDPRRNTRESSDPKLASHCPPISNSKLLGQSLVSFRCLDLGHFKWQCKSSIRCAHCLDLGHIQRFCKAQTPGTYKLEWRPKTSVTQSSPKTNWKPVKLVETPSTKTQVHPHLAYTLDSYTNASSASTSINKQNEFAIKSSIFSEHFPDPSLSTKASRQSTLGYTHGTSLLADRCASY